MLPRAHCLDSKKIPEVIKKGKRINSWPFSLAVLSEPKLQTTQFAFVVSKKVTKKAVHRNRTKRLLQEAVFNLLSRIKPGFKIIIFAKKPLKEEKLQSVLPQVEEVFKKHKITNNG